MHIWGISVVVCISFLFHINSINACDGNWILNGENSHSYFFSDCTLNWFSAKQQCEQMSANLAVINDPEENAFIHDEIKVIGVHWIGLTGPCTRLSCSVWNWINDELVMYTNWVSSSYPTLQNNYNGVYIHSSNGLWRNAAPNIHHHFVCEQEKYSNSNNLCGENAYITLDQGNQTENVSCTCHEGFTGTLCETNIDECASEPCVNGTCVDQNGQYFCACSDGYSGTNCETQTDTCKIEKPCHHGNCQNTFPGKYKCECEGQWTGENCDIESTWSVGFIIVIALVSFAILIGLSILGVMIAIMLKLQKLLVLLNGQSDNPHVNLDEDGRQTSQGNNSNDYTDHAQETYYNVTGPIKKVDQLKRGANAQRPASNRSSQDSYETVK